jgi:DNA replication and repair protein RecF
MSRAVFCRLRILQAMLALRNIIITHFKNYELSQFSFPGNIVGICGLNGKGKTNLLDAIYYCSFTKSYFAATDSLNIGFGREGFRLEANFELSQQNQKVICIHRGSTRKEFSLNDAPYDKFSKHIGCLPTVMIAPDDTEIITGSSELRRKYIDTILSQLDPAYLSDLIVYNKVLQQRNSLLKRFAEQKNWDDTLLSILNDQLTAPGNRIYEKRKNFTSRLIPLVQSFYNRIAENDETVTLSYESRLHDNPFDELLKRDLDKDRILQRTNSGIHKDDLGISLFNQVFRNIASQGQRKSLLFALKLAEYEMIRTEKGFAPLLLLDDVFEKLDDLRMNNLLHWVCLENEGQVFITDTHRNRLEEMFLRLGVPGQIVEL